MASRQMTEKEVRDKLLKEICGLVDFWDKEAKGRSTHGKLDGLAFSILSLLDGSHVDLPAFIVAPRPHESDKNFHKDKKENWFPENLDPNIECDLGGTLHEYYAKVRKVSK